MELWDAYDQSMNKLEGMTLVRGEPVPEGCFHLVCEILVRHRDGSILLMQRDFRKPLGGMWEASAGGSALQGETPLECARRELSEETGILSDTLREVGRIIHPGHRAIFVEYLCLTDIAKDQIVLQEGETVAFRWVSDEQLRTIKKEELATCRIWQFLNEPAQADRPESQGTPYMPEVLEAKHIRLRKARENDWKSMLEAVWSDEAVYQWMLYTPTLTEEDARDRCQRSIRYQKDHYAYFVALRDTDEAIGLCAIRENEPGHFEESGICIGTRYQGHGYGKEIVALLLDLAFLKLGATDFRYGYFRENLRSRRLAEHFGFRYDQSYEFTRPWDGAVKQIDSCILLRETYLAQHQTPESEP